MVGCVHNGDYCERAQLIHSAHVRSTGTWTVYFIGDLEIVLSLQEAFAVDVNEYISTLAYFYRPYHGGDRFDGSF